jgi:hypothetical protein
MGILTRISWHLLAYYLRNILPLHHDILRSKYARKILLKDEKIVVCS